MLINNLYFWFQSTFFLLISTEDTQLDFLFGGEEILNSLNIDIGDYTYLFKVPSILTPISFDTFQSVISSIWDHYEYHLRFRYIHKDTISY